MIADHDSDRVMRTGPIMVIQMPTEIQTLSSSYSLKHFCKLAVKLSWFIGFYLLLRKPSTFSLLWQEVFTYFSSSLKWSIITTKINSTAFPLSLNSSSSVITHVWFKNEMFINSNFMLFLCHEILIHYYCLSASFPLLLC